MTHRPPESTRSDTLLPYTRHVRAAFERGRRHASRMFRAHARRYFTQGEIARRSQRQQADLTVQHGEIDMAAAPATLTADQGRQNAYRCPQRSEEHTSELQSLMPISYAVFCFKQKTENNHIHT